jgi:HK97 family phage major capsid protein
MDIQAKSKKLNELLDGIAVLTMEMEAEEGKGNTPENREKLTALLNEGETLRKSIEQDNQISGLKAFVSEPFAGSKTMGGDGAIAQPFASGKSLGDQIIEAYKAGGEKRGISQSFQAKGFFTTAGAIPANFKATFDSTAAGLDTSRNYVTPPGGLVLIEQQRLTIRDLLPVGETTQNTIYYPKETLYTNAAETVAEEGQKPEATLDIESASAPVKKIAVLIKVSDEMWDDFPMLRDYVNSRLRFMVEQKEEDQLLNGSGTGNNITGILNTSGIQTQAEGADTPVDAIFKAMTKIKTPASNVGGYNPSGIVMNPTDVELIRLSKDANNQYYFGGPAYAPYGNGPYAAAFKLWGLPVVETTAITAGTALVGDFRMGAQIFQRTGIDVKTFDQNEDDVNFNRKTIRVEERLALAVYRPSAFCTVTSID